MKIFAVYVFQYLIVAPGFTSFTEKISNSPCCIDRIGSLTAEFSFYLKRQGFEKHSSQSGLIVGNNDLFHLSPHFLLHNCGEIDWEYRLVDQRHLVEIVRLWVDGSERRARWFFM